MQSWHRTALVALVAFCAGALIATAVVPGVERDGAPAQQPSPDVPVEQAAPPPRERVRVNDVDAALSGDELEFLRRALAAERVRRRGARIPQDLPGLDVVQRWIDGADVTDLVSDFAAMRAHVRTAPEPVAFVASTGGRTDVDLSDYAIGDSGVIEFGPGTFVLQTENDAWNETRGNTESLEIRGAGMDKTTLIAPMHAFLVVNKGGYLRNVVIRDLTIDADGEAIILSTGGGLAVALERVRLRGWKLAGHAAAIGVTGSGFLALRGCEIIGPGDGFALSLRGRTLATLDWCTIKDVEQVFVGWESPRAHGFAYARDCRFENAKLADSRATGVEIHVSGGSVLLGSAGESEEARLERWGAKYAKSVEDLIFEDVE